MGIGKSLASWRQLHDNELCTVVSSLLKCVLLLYKEKQGGHWWMNVLSKTAGMCQWADDWMKLTHRSRTKTMREAIAKGLCMIDSATWSLLKSQCSVRDPLRILSPPIRCSDCSHELKFQFCAEYTRMLQLLGLGSESMPITDYGFTCTILNVSENGDLGKLVGIHLLSSSFTFGWCLFCLRPHVYALFSRWILIVPVWTV